MALSSPIGSATTIAIADTSIVPATSGSTPKRGRGEERRPLGAEQELGDRHLAQERDRLDRQDDDDADGRANGEQGAQEQRPLDQELEPLHTRRVIAPWRAALRASCRPGSRPRRTPCPAFLSAKCFRASS